MRIFWRIVVVLVVIAAILGIGFYAYNLGVAQTMAQKVPAPSTGTVPAYPYYWPPYFGVWHGFGFLGCLVPLFLLFLVFGGLRFIFWRGPWGWRRHMMHRYWAEHPGEGEDKDVPPFFEEWHRRAHGEPPAEKKSDQ